MRIRFSLLVIMAVVFLCIGLSQAQEKSSISRKLRLGSDSEKPALTTVEGAPLSFIADRREVVVPHSEGERKIEAYTRVDLVVNADGSILLGNGSLHGGGRETVKGVDDLRRMLYYAGQKNYREKDGCSSADLVIYAAPKTPFIHIQKIMQVSGEEHNKIYRFHFAVRDAKTGKEGVVTYFLPREIGLLESGEKPPQKERYEIFFTGDRDGAPLYQLNRIGKREKTLEFDSLDKLVEAFDALKAEKPDAEFYFSVGGVVYTEAAAEDAKTRVEHFVRLLAALASRGVDLSVTAPVIVEDIVPLPRKRKQDR